MCKKFPFPKKWQKQIIWFDNDMLLLQEEMQGTTQGVLFDLNSKKGVKVIKEILKITTPWKCCAFVVRTSFKILTFKVLFLFAR